MKCPLHQWFEAGEDDNEIAVYGDCLKEECAWWQKELKNCIVYQMGMELGVLAALVEDIYHRLPEARE